MEKRQLGNTSLSVGPIGYGAMHLSIDAEKRPDPSESIAMIRRAVDEAELDFIDTADAYCTDASEKGHNERLIAEALSEGGRREKVLVATKGGLVRPGGSWERNGRPEHLRQACEDSIAALDVDHIDLYQYHAPDPDVPIADSLGTLADLQREGKIRHIGVSNFTVDQIEQARKEAIVVSVQNQYSAMNRRNEDEVIDYCEEHSISYLPWNPVGGRGDAPDIGSKYAVLQEIADAHESSPHSVALAWLLQRSPVVVPIPGTTKFGHLLGNLDAAGLELTAEEVERLDTLDKGT